MGDRVLRGARRQRSGSAAHDHHRSQHGGRAASFHPCHRFDPLFQRIHAEAAGRGRNPLALLLHAKQRHRVGPSRLPALPGQHALVAQQLHVPVDEEEHPTDRRVHPVQAEARGRRQLAQRVQCADVMPLVQQHKVQRFRITCVHGRWQQDDRAKHAEGHRRGNPAAQAHAHRAAQIVRSHKRLNLRPRARQRFRQHAPPAGIQPRKADGQNQRAGQPQGKQRRFPRKSGLRRRSNVPC